jgi:hypothetical protein
MQQNGLDTHRVLLTKIVEEVPPKRDYCQRWEWVLGKELLTTLVGYLFRLVLWALHFYQDPRVKTVRLDLDIWEWDKNDLSIFIYWKSKQGVFVGKITFYKFLNILHFIKYVKPLNIMMLKLYISYIIFYKLNLPTSCSEPTVPLRPLPFSICF